MNRRVFHRLASIRDGWDQAATEDAINYILGSKCKRNLDLETFFDLKARQAEECTADFFQEMRFTPAEKRMLDIGCGIGAMTRYFSEAFAEAHGLDISAAMVKKAHSLNKEKPNLYFATNNGFDLSTYKDGFFDFCFSFATFQYFPNRVVVENFFKEIARVLKSEGLFRIQLDGRDWVSSRIPVPIYRPLHNVLRNNYFFRFYGRLITDRVTVRAYRGMAISWKTVSEILRQLPFQVSRITDKGTSHMWVSGRRN